MYVKNSRGEFSKINASHEVKLSPGNNAIRFKLDCPGYNHAYVIGDFNNYQQTAKSRLGWLTDPNDGNLKMSIEMLFSESLASGIHEYNFILIDNQGNELVLSPTRNPNDRFSFAWNPIQPSLLIMASQNNISLKQPVDLVAVLAHADNSKQVLNNLKWQVSPTHPLIKFKQQQLIVHGSIDGISELTISCSDSQSGLSASKRFNLLNIEQEGCLLHFIKSAKDYAGEQHIWDLWSFNEDGSSQALPFSANSDFGPTAQITSVTNIIVRRRAWGYGWNNDWSDQSIAYQLDLKRNNYYIIYGDNNLYSDLTQVIDKMNPRIELAVMDDAQKITAQLSQEPLIGTKFYLYVNSKLQNNAEVLIKDEKRQIIFNNLLTKIAPADLVEIRASISFQPTTVAMRNYLDSFYYPHSDMGVSFTEDGLELRLWAPTANKVELLTYTGAEQDKLQPDKIYLLNSEKNYGTHAIKLPRSEAENKFYLYRLHFKALDSQQQSYLRNTYAIDPYALAMSSNGKRGVLLDLANPLLKPHNWDNDCRPFLRSKADSILYELHIRDFTINKQSGITKNLRGKYLGMVAGLASYSDDRSGRIIKTGIDSLVELGITHVHLLPFFDYSSVDEDKPNTPGNRNWGYDPQNYNAPEGSYASNSADPVARIKETRAMIQGFHQKGIRVVMDVVYNHMTNTNNFDKIVPGYYFRQDHLGKYSNGSGCGNELATEHPMVSKFILDSICHWLNDYKIDGLRLDLMELMDYQTMQKIVEHCLEIDPSILIYGEPWKGGDSPLKNPTYRGLQKNAGFSIFNDIFRDAIRGNNAPAKGFVNGEQHNSSVNANLHEGLRGSINGLTAAPQESINYVDAHDNYTLWDHLEKSQNSALLNGKYRQNLPANLLESSLVRQNLLALGIILSAQGIPFLQGGAEILRTKQGDHNSYKSNDEINAFYWQDKLEFKPIFNYVRGLIKLRKEHPAFRLRNRQQVFEHMTIQNAHNDPGSGVIITHLNNHANGDEWKNIVVIYNATAIDDYDINKLIPSVESGSWNIVVNHEFAGTDIISQVAAGTLPPLRSHSMMVIYNN